MLVVFIHMTALVPVICERSVRHRQRLLMPLRFKLASVTDPNLSKELYARGQEGKYCVSSVRDGHDKHKGNRICSSHIVQKISVRNLTPFRKLKTGSWLYLNSAVLREPSA